MKALRCPVCGEHPRVFAIHNEFVCDCDCGFSEAIEVVVDDSLFDSILSITYTKEDAISQWNRRVRFSEELETA